MIANEQSCTSARGLFEDALLTVRERGRERAEEKRPPLDLQLDVFSIAVL